MSDNYSDSFEAQSIKSGAARGGAEEQAHQLKLSVDLLSVRNMAVAANVFTAYQITLKEVH